MNPLLFLGLDKENQWRVSKDIAYSNTIHTPSGLYKYVCNHFGLDTLKEACIVIKAVLTSSFSDYINMYVITLD